MIKERIKLDRKIVPTKLNIEVTINDIKHTC